MHHRIKIHMSIYCRVFIGFFLKQNEAEGILRTNQLLLIFVDIKLNTNTEHEYGNEDQVNFFEIGTIQSKIGTFVFTLHLCFKRIVWCLKTIFLFCL